MGEIPVTGDSSIHLIVNILRSGTWPCLFIDVETWAVILKWIVLSDSMDLDLGSYEIVDQWIFFVRSTVVIDTRLLYCQEIRRDHKQVHKSFLYWDLPGL